MPKKRESCIVEPTQTGRIDRVIQAMTGLSRSKVQVLFDRGCVQCNQSPCSNVAHRVVAGDQVDLEYDPGQGYRAPRKAWSDRTFTIVHEDDDLLVVNKSAKVLTIQQDHGLDRNTLLERVELYLKAQTRKKPLVVHRLDRDMSGLVVFAKTPAAAKALQAQFLQHQPQRRYTLIVAGSELPDKGQFQSYVAVSDNLDQYSTHQAEGQLSTTHFQKLQNLGAATLVTAYPEAGQPNHIRWQFAENGFPVLGDKRYTRKLTAGMKRKQAAEALETLQHPGWKKTFLAMHASHLSFIHPTTEKRVSFEAPLPKAMRHFIRGHRNAESS